MSVEIWRVPHETKEWIGPVTVTANGIGISSWEGCLLADGTRPLEADWQTPDSIGPDKGIMIGSGTNYPTLTKGSYILWVRFNNGTEVPVSHRAGIVVVD